MAKAAERRAEGLLMRVCRAIDKAMASRVQQWIGTGTVANLTDLDSDRLDLAIIACKQRGWVATGANRAHSILLLAAGREAIRV